MKSSLKIDFLEDGTPFILIKDYAGNDMGDARDKLIRNFVVDTIETGLVIRCMTVMDEYDGNGSHYGLIPLGKAKDSFKSNRIPFGADITPPHLVTGTGGSK